MQFPVVNDQRDEPEGQGHGRNASSQRAGQVVPDGCRHREQDGGGQHGVRAAEVVQQWNQRQTSARRPEQIEEIDPVHALNSLRDSQRDNRAGKKEWQRTGEKDRGQSTVAHNCAREREAQAPHHHEAVENSQRSQLEINVSTPACHHVGEYAAGSQPEQGDRDSEESEVIKENHGEDARKGQFEDQSGKRGEGHAQIHLRPLSLTRIRG